MLDSTYQSRERKKAPLTAIEREFILLTQNGLPIVSKPYHLLAEKLNMSVNDVLAMSEDLLERGVIRRIAAVPNHYRAGYTFNGMTVWDVQDDEVKNYGALIGRLPFVSHCYQRPRCLPDWNYNLFAMIHGKNAEQISEYRTQIKELLKDVLQTGKHNTNDMLTSSKILKKTGLRLQAKKE
ncbi:Lrp/AsnC family transcriptional regulator [Thalassotalea nanhaiensis]|uniref:siroheme decarboxylase n=1 Tax=Thalassotalea nanhaiensis TaxID=3065648 RepID=A0ABY9THP9_9GAMM|nr:Lrp/AsnC family transcriptional regulator [Colwelliaceae bacterium SQ345]